MNKQRWTDDQVEQTMGQLLRTGVILAASVVLLGGVIYVARHGRDVPDYKTFHSVPAAQRSITGTVESAFSLEGRGIIQLGVLLLVATPVARVMLSVVAFAQQRDWRYIMVTLFVLAVLFYSLARGYLEQSPDTAAQARSIGPAKRCGSFAFVFRQGPCGRPTPRPACDPKRQSCAGYVARVPSPFRS
ncbi:MAG TPA: DUF1634 domain-containing protein [Pirellulales bacterium]|jgi:uncharacterized membrane protein|nr:DUF1634 domain-containing protein [Pirellulales bacterium]